MVRGVSPDTDVDRSYYQNKEDTIHREPRIHSYDLDYAHCHGYRRVAAVFTLCDPIGHGPIVCILLGMDRLIPAIIFCYYAHGEDMVLQSIWR